MFFSEVFANNDALFFNRKIYCISYNNNISSSQRIKAAWKKLGSLLWEQL